MCVSPLKGFKVGVNPSGKPSYKITSYSCHHVEQQGDSIVESYIPVMSPYADHAFYDWIEIDQ